MPNKNGKLGIPNKKTKLAAYNVKTFDGRCHCNFFTSGTNAKIALKNYVSRSSDFKNIINKDADEIQITIKKL